MFTYSTPGAYYERVDAGAPTIAPVRMDVAGFVGIAKMGPLHTAVPIASWRQFVVYFGDVTNSGYLAYAVRAFFENGGRRCWVVRSASEAAQSASCDVRSVGGAPGFRVSAASPGVWGNGLDVQWRATHRGQTTSIPASSTPEYSTVTSITGFVRGSHVRLVDSNASAIVRVVSRVDAASSRLYWVNPTPAQRLPYDAALSGLELDLPLLIESIEYTLIVRESAVLLAVYEELSLVPEHPRYGPAILSALLIDAAGTPSWDLSASPNRVVLSEQRSTMDIFALAPLDVASLGVVSLAAGVVGADGLASLRVEDFIGEASDPFDTDVNKARKQRGLAALDDVREVAAVAIPDIHIQPLLPSARAPLPPCVPDPCLPAPPPGPAAPPPTSPGDLPPIFDDEAVYRVQAELVRHCERHADRVALLDPPFSTVRDARLGSAAIRAWRKRFDSKYAALYYPWAEVVDPLRNGDRTTRAIPPSGHVAGYFALSDKLVGVHKAPANGALCWVQAMNVPIDDATHGLLDDEQIDVIRALPGRGARILGARTLWREDAFRYVNVRRLLIFIERALDLSCKWAVFEPNDERTRFTLHLSVTSFLLGLWQKGAFAGKTPREAFFVRCNQDTTPEATRELGQLVMEIGVAPAIPFEFVVVRIGRADNQFELSEGSSNGGLH